MPEPVKTDRLHVIKYALILTVAWTAIVGAAFAWSVIQVKNTAQDAAHIEAEKLLEKDIQYRHWNADRGGVYVLASEETPPNPYLANVPERDVTTPSGRLLTLVNPACIYDAPGERNGGNPAWSKKPCYQPESDSATKCRGPLGD